MQQTRLLYAGANRLTATRLATLDLPEGNAMRAPGEAPGLMALEIAMDEMAEKLGMDPIEFRILNDTQVDPEKPERPFSQRQLDRMPAHRRGALRLEQAQCAAGPHARRPLADRHGRRRGVPQQPADRSRRARVRLDATGSVTVETDMTDIGTGSYTIIAQTAAEMMGVPLDQVVVQLGDPSFPGVGGLGRAMGRQQLDRRRLCRVRQAARGGGAEARLQLGGRCSSPTARWPLGAIAACRSRRPRGGASWSAEDTIEFGDLAKTAPAVDLRRAFRRGRRRCGYTGRESASGACWRCAPPAASSTRNRRAAR